MEFPEEWARVSNESEVLNRRPAMVPSSSSRQIEGSGDAPKDVVDQAWDIFQVAMRARDEPSSSSSKKNQKRRSSKSDGGASASTALTADEEANEARRPLKRPGIRMSTSSTSIKPPPPPSESLPLSPSKNDDDETTEQTPKRREICNLSSKEIAHIAIGVVKSILKPMYAERAIDRETFKRTARVATQAAVDACTISPHEITLIVHRLLDM